MMYKATKVSGVFEKVPEPLRGVFWMRGNPMPDELTVLQYGSWFPDEGLYLTGVAPFSWSYPASKPKNAPYFGAAYSNSPKKGASNAFNQASSAEMYSYRF